MVHQQEPEVAEAFQIHLERLRKYIEKNKQSLNESENKKLTEILNRLKKGERIQGDWKKHLTHLIKKPTTPKKETWEILNKL